MFQWSRSATSTPLSTRMLPSPSHCRSVMPPGPTDAGLYAGMCVLSDYTISANADGEWDWSIEAQTSGEVSYTAPTP